MNRKTIIQEFKYMRNFAELKALSNVSLERPFSNMEFNRMMELKNKVLKGGLEKDGNNKTRS